MLDKQLHTTINIAYTSELLNSRFLVDVSERERITMEKLMIACA
jgi:hypothetical protein